MNDIIMEAYDVLHNLEMTHSNAEFSIRYLGRTKDYWAMRKSTDTECSLAALFHLAATLKSEYETLKGSRWGEHRERGEQLYPLVRKVWTASYQTALGQ